MTLVLDPPRPVGIPDLAAPIDRTASSRDAVERPATPSWDAIVDEHWDAVYRHARRLAGRHEDAEDLAQETFIRAFVALPNFENRSMSGWLHRIATNAFLDRMRRTRRIRFDPLPDDTDLAEPPNLDHPEIAYFWNQLDPALAAALADLPMELRTTLLLRVLSDRSDAEIAQLLGTRPGTVRSRVHRARARVRSHLESSAGSDESDSPGSSRRWAVGSGPVEV